MSCRGQLEEARARALGVEDALERFRQQSLVSHRSTRRIGLMYPAATYSFGEGPLPVRTGERAGGQVYVRSKCFFFFWGKAFAAFDHH